MISIQTKKYDKISKLIMNFRKYFKIFNIKLNKLFNIEINYFNILFNHIFNFLFIF